MIFLCGINVSAQDFQSYKKQQQESLKQYRQKNQDDWEAYRRKMNEEFASFLKKPWEKAAGEKPLTAKPSVPDVPPVVLPDKSKDIPKDKPINVVVKPRLQVKESPRPVPIVPYTPKPEEKRIDFTFFGTEASVRFNPEKKKNLTGEKEESVSRFWQDLSGNDYDNLVHDCLEVKEEKDLCDWAFYKMAEALSLKLYKDNAAAVFHAWLLAQAGYKVRLGRDNGIIHVLTGIAESVFYYSYWNLSGQKYYLLDGSKVSSMNVIQQDFPGSRPLSLAFNGDTDLDDRPGNPRRLFAKKYPSVNPEVRCNLNRISFLGTYPSFAIGTTHNQDWRNYASAPLSATAKEKLYPSLKKAIGGKSETEAVSIILNFVQTAFEYKTDGEVWGRERAFFPEETLSYPFCDCEDRSILFCRLVKDLLGLDTAFISYPGHVAAAVKFTTEVTGDYFTIEGKKYLICDPTYINAGIGLSMPNLDNSKAQAYLF